MPGQPQDRSTLRAWWLLPSVLSGLGLTVRLLYIDYDLPEVVWVDASKFVDQAADMVSSGHYAPRSFQYPGFYTYTLALLDALLGLRTRYAQHLCANLVSAVLSTGVVPATWWLARRVCESRPAAALAALLAALSPVLVTYGRIPCTDGIAATFVTVATAAALAPVLDARAGALVGLAAGLAAGSKFTGAYGLLPLALTLTSAVWSRELPLRRALSLALGAGALACAVFLATTPFFLAALPDYLARMRTEGAIQAFGQIGRVQLGRFDYLWSPTPTWESPWLGTSIAGCEGPVVLAVGLMAVALALFGRLGRAAWPCAIAFALYWGLMSAPGHLKAIRFFTLVLPLLFVLCAKATEALCARVPRGRAWVAAACAVCLLAVPGGRTWGMLAMYASESTNVLARRWVRAHVPPGSTVLLAPFFTNDLAAPDLRIGYFRQPGARQYRLPPEIGESPERSPLFHPAMVKGAIDGGARFFVGNSYFMDAFSAVPENQRWFPRSVETYREFMQALAASSDLVFEARGLAAGRMGPDIRIYRLHDTAAPAASTAR